MNEKMKPLNELGVEETPQKTYTSTTISHEEFAQLSENFYNDDITGGLQNIVVPPEELEKIVEQEKEASKTIIVGDDNAPHKTDKVMISLTPEELVILRQVVENFSVYTNEIVEYIQFDDGMDLYKQQGIVRDLRDKIDENIDSYVKKRPYNPFFTRWVKRIGKENVRKMQD